MDPEIGLIALEYIFDGYYCVKQISQMNIHTFMYASFPLLTEYYSADHIEKHELYGTCSTVRRDEMCLLGFGGVPWGRKLLWRHRHRWKDNAKMEFQEIVLGKWSRIIWLRISICNGFLWTRKYTADSHKMRWIFWRDEDLLVSQERLWSKELLSHVYLTPEELLDLGEYK